MLMRLGRGMASVHSGKQILPTDIDGNLQGVVFDVDATQLASYDGASPINLLNLADTGSTYDFWGGASADNSDDQQFVGTAGTPSAYFNSDTTNRGFMVQQGGVEAIGQPEFFADFHKGSNTSPRTLVICFRSPSDWTVGDGNILGTQNTNPIRHGFKLTYKNANGTGNLKTNLYVEIQTGSSTIDMHFPGTFIPEDKDIMIALTLESDGSTMTGTVRLNSSEPKINTMPNTASTDADGKMTLMNDDSFSHMPIGSRFYAASGFNKAITDDEFNTLAGIYALRHSRIYIDAPDIASLSGLHMRLHNYHTGTSGEVEVRGIRVYDGGIKGVGTERFEALTPVNGAPGNSFATISAGEYTSDSDNPSAASVSRLGDAWTTSLPHRSDSANVGGLGIWVEFSSNIDLRQISLQLQSQVMDNINLDDFQFLTPSGEYIVPTSKPADLDDNDTSQDTPNTNAYTWLF